MMVFDQQWFSHYQKPLLRFANSRLGRYVFRIHGKRSDVGHNKITYIAPHYIQWSEVDGTRIEFRTHAKFSKRLYHAFKPFWWTMHAWDMVVANKLNESLNLGFDTLAFFSDTAYGGTTVDGYVYATNSGSTFSAVQSRSSGTSISRASAEIVVRVKADINTNDWGTISRSFMTFDTSAIPNTATITSGSLRMLPNAVSTALGTDTVHVVASTQASANNLTTADFPRIGATTFGSLALGSHTVGSYASFNLNSSGLSAINVSGISKYALRMSWDLNNSFGGAWAYNAETGAVYVSSDDTGSIDDPALTVVFKQTYSASIASTLSFSATASPTAVRNAQVSDTLRFSASATANKVIAPVAGKEYVYRVYNATGTFIGVWSDVADEPEFTQPLNSPGTTMTVKLARSADRTIEQRAVLTTQSGETLLTQDDNDLVAVFETTNTVGSDTDVDLNYQVDVYAHYGGFEELTTQDGELLTTQDGENLIVSVGAPLGRRIFSGFILDYDVEYAASSSITVTLASHGLELSNEIIMSGSDTTKAFSSQDHGTIFKNILDTNPGTMSYDADSITNTGITIDETFRLNTKLEGLESVYNQTPDGWSWHGDVGENVVYLKPAGTSADHTFLFKKHLQKINLRRSMEDLRNVVYFVGGDTGGGSILYKKYSDATSISAWRQGVHRITDRRYTVAANAQKVSEKIISRYKNPIYRTSITVLAGVYDIETIKLGQMVGFGNFDNFVDSLLLQIVSINYTPRKVTLELGELLLRTQDIIDDLAQDIEGEQYLGIPNVPS